MSVAFLAVLLRVETTNNKTVGHLHVNACVPYWDQTQIVIVFYQYICISMITTE